jgi:FkbM family methyltransferase
LGAESHETAAVIERRKRAWERLREPRTIRWLHGLRLRVYPGNEMSRYIFVTGCYEPNEFYLLDKVLRPGMTFIDVGANMGVYTLFASRKVGKTGEVVAIEPSSRDFERLRDSVELNRLANVRLVQVAVSSRRAQAELLIAAEEHSGHNTLGAFAYDTVVAQGKERVRVERLDDIVEQERLGRVDAIKMDVEGAELLALEGAERALARFRPMILLELSDRALVHQGCTSGQVWDFLGQRGYRTYAFAEDTGLPVPAQRKEYFDSENIIALHQLSGAPWLR